MYYFQIWCQVSMTSWWYWSSQCWTISSTPTWRKQWATKFNHFTRLLSSNLKAPPLNFFLISCWVISSFSYYHYQLCFPLPTVGWWYGSSRLIIPNVWPSPALSPRRLVQCSLLPWRHQHHVAAATAPPHLLRWGTGQCHWSGVCLLSGPTWFQVHNIVHTRIGDIF